MDAFDTWSGARSDFDRIPFGMIEGRGLSDPSKLIEFYGWTAGQLVRRYVWVGCMCLAVLAVVYGVALFRARARAREA